MNETQKQLFNRADKYWNEVVSQMRWDSPFLKQAIEKLQGMYDIAKKPQ
jgi:hypothetical protein